MNTRLLTAMNTTASFLEKYCRLEETDRPDWKIRLDEAVGQSYLDNQWFIREFVMTALSSVASMLAKDKLEKWLSAYPLTGLRPDNSKRIGVISAGNIPLAGFHDFLCVLLTGHHYTGKLSAQDRVLLPVVAGFITELYPEAAEQVCFTEDKLRHYDAVIATGSNNSFRYFEYYFRNFPKILRKNRNSIAILTGTETNEDLARLGDDIFLYFGLGCRNVSKIFIPEGFDITVLFQHWSKYSFLQDHYKYHNNYSYYKSIYLVNRAPHFDNGFVLLKPESGNTISPVSVIYYEEYRNIDELTLLLGSVKDQLQCIVGSVSSLKEIVPFGGAQFPGPEEYADGVDTLDFLLNL